MVLNAEPWGNTVHRIGYGFNDAAEAAGVRKQDIAHAVRSGLLIAHRVNDEPVILRTDIQAWIESQPRWLTK